MKSKHHSLFVVVAAVGLWLGTHGRAYSQTALAEITGEVTDPTGAPVALVAITLTNTATGIKATLSSNEVGRFYVRSVAPGVYDIEAAKSGFKTFRANRVEIGTGQVLRYDIALEIGDMTTKVEVTAQAGAVELQKDSADVSTLINQRTVQEMPILNRKVLNLVQLAPGVTWQFDNGLQPFFSMAGNPGSRSNMYVLDGANVGYPRTQGDGGTLPLVSPAPEVVSEMRIVANNYSAEFGEGIGGVIMLTTKSGTNEFHGLLYHYLQNDVLEARNFFAGPTKPKNRYQHSGGLISGPIIKNRTHFLYHFERSSTRSGGPSILTVPSTLQRRGDFSQTFNAAGQVIPIYDPASTRTENGKLVRDPFAGNIVPTNRFDPVAIKVLDYWPDPNRSGFLTGGNNFISDVGSRGRQNNGTDHVRIDHQFNSKDRIYGRWNYFRQDGFRRGAFQGTKGEGADPGAVTYPSYWPNLSLAWTRIVSANTLSEFRFNRGNTRFYNTAFGNSEGKKLNFAEKLGLKNLSPDAFPNFGVSGYNEIGGGSGYQELLQDAMRALTFEEMVSMHRGRHNVRMGGTWKHSRAIFARRLAPSGKSSYDARATALPGVSGTGNGFASFLVGEVASASVQDTPAPDIRTWYVGGFLQDDWRVNRSLTLNLGVRYEYDQPKVDVTDRVSFFNGAKINPACNCPGVIEFGANKWAVTRKHEPFYNALMKQIGPRFGFAWTPLSRQDVVVRGGYGVFFTGLDYGDNFWSLPLLGSGTNQDWTADGLGATPAFRLRDGFPKVLKEPLTDDWGAVAIGQSPRVSPDWYYPTRPAGYAQQFNLGIQKQVGKIFVELGYLGNATRKRGSLGININEVPPSLLGPGNAQIRRPFPQFGNVFAHGIAIADSIYHAALISVKRNYSNGLSFQSNYTFSRFLNNTSYFRSYYNRAVDRGPSGLELRHRFIWAGVYELPWGPRKKFLNTGWLGNIFGNVSIGSIFEWRGGLPGRVQNLINTCNCFTGGNQGVNLVGNPKQDHSSFDPGRDVWFNTAAFASPELYTFGNAQGNGLYRYPGVVNVDTTLTKGFKIRERITAELRGEFYNFFNHANFAAPDVSLGSPTFGRVSGAANARKAQVGMKVYF